MTPPRHDRAPGRTPGAPAGPSRVLGHPGACILCGGSSDGKLQCAACREAPRTPDRKAKAATLPHREPAVAVRDGAVLRLVLPVPPVEIRPNGRAHKMKAARATAGARRLAETTLLTLGHLPTWTAATLAATWFFAGTKPVDDDNAAASLKAYRDGIADSGVVANDQHIQALPVVVARDPARPRVELTLSPVDTNERSG